MHQKKSGRISIGVDMDGVLADTETQFITYYEKETGEKFDKSAMIGVPESAAFPDKAAPMRYILSPGFFRTLPLIEGGVDAIRKLMENFEVYIVSAAVEFPLSLYEKKLWLEEHFPFIPWTHIVFCGDKSIIKTDYLIDDHLKNLDYFSGIPLMFTAAHNVKADHHKRLNNWQEILEYFEEIK